MRITVKFFLVVTVIQSSDTVINRDSNGKYHVCLDHKHRRCMVISLLQKIERQQKGYPCPFIPQGQAPRNVQPLKYCYQAREGRVNADVLHIVHSPLCILFDQIRLAERPMFNMLSHSLRTKLYRQSACFTLDEKIYRSELAFSIL